MSVLTTSSLLAGMVVLSAAMAFGAETTNVVDIAALAACSTGTTNGWATAGIDSYNESFANIRFNANGEYALSPDFGAPVVRIELKLMSSSESGRRLAFVPVRDGEEVHAERLECEYSPNKDTFVDRTIEVPAGCVFSRFKMALTEANGTTTAWGVSSLRVITAGEPAPASLAVVGVRSDRFTAVWESPSGAVSNEVVVTREVHVPFSADFAVNYDFEKFSNVSTKTELTDKFIGLYPDFDGERLYAPTNSSGVVRIGAADYRGELVFKGYSSYAGLSLVVRAQKGEKAKHHAPVVWIADGVTNSIGKIEATNEMQYFILPLNDVPGGEALHIFSCVGDFQTKTDTQLFVDSVGLATRAVPEHDEEQAVARAFASGGRLTIGSLERGTTYRWRVRSFLGDGSATAWSALQEVVTGDEPAGGAAIYLR